MSSIASLSALRRVPAAVNEPIKSYAPGSPERAELKARLASMATERVEIPLIIGGKEIRTGKTAQSVMPFLHGHVLADYHMASPEHVQQAIAAALSARREWANWPWEDRAAVILKAAELLATTWKSTLNAATMLGQAKTAYQSEIDAACELIDFWRFNAQYAQEIYGDQPANGAGVWNQLEYRALEGFIYAVSPFNFTAIGGNLSSAPALMGNTVVWKPATTAALSAQVIMDILAEAGLPRGVINLVHAPGRVIGEVALTHSALAGVHFTGSTQTFNGMWLTVAQNLPKYRCYPRLVGETGGKDFIFAHPSCDLEALVTAVVRGGFEYQGQKCSAASRVYVPKSLFKTFGERLGADLATIKMGDVTDFGNFMGAVIDASAFKDHAGYIEYARKNAGGAVWLGGTCDNTVGYFVAPTVVRVDDPQHRLMREEIFGPVVTVYAYDDAKLEDTLRLCEGTSPYALTGAIFARDRAWVTHAMTVLRGAAGNFYINDKPTGAVVGQQPFGGSRASGTNDKAGSVLNLLRWTSPRSIKETFDPPRDYRYPFLAKEA